MQNFGNFKKYCRNFAYPLIFLALPHLACIQDYRKILFLQLRGEVVIGEGDVDAESGGGFNDLDGHHVFGESLVFKGDFLDRLAVLVITYRLGFKTRFGGVIVAVTIAERVGNVYPVISLPK